MCHGERTLFGEEWWKIAPFALAATTEKPSDYLADYMADIAVLLEDAKKTRLVIWEHPSVELEYRARAILHQLYSWRWSWLARNRDGVFEVDAKDTEAFGTVLRYAQPHLMYDIWLCNALVILLLGFLNPLELLREQHTTPALPTGYAFRIRSHER